MYKRKCKICQAKLLGRTDKIYCSIKCKNYYHVRLRQATAKAVKETDKILHRNRSILLEIMGKESTQKIVNRKLLDAKKFNWHYVTHYHINSKNKQVHYVYDFSWIIFSNQEIIIRRKS
jgi:hypothetical protein